MCARLLDRGVQCPSMCAMCEDNYEDAIHALFDCPRARNVWCEGNMWQEVNTALQQHNTVAEIPRARNVWCEGNMWQEVNTALQQHNTVAEIVFALLQDLSQTKVEQL
jgi:hypothetical protein